MSVLLVAAIVGTGNGISTMAQYSKPKKEVTEKKEEKLSAREIAEQIADGTYKGKKLKETKYYDTYEASDGSIVAAYYSSPVRFEDEEGALREYNPDLIKTKNEDAYSYTGDVMSQNYDADKYAYVNTAGNSRQYFPKELNDNTPILMEKDEYSLSLTPVFNVEADVNNNDLSGQSGAIEEGVIKTSDDEVEYVKDNITYQYVSMDNGVKENIIINDRYSKLTYSLHIH